MFGSREFVNNS